MNPHQAIMEPLVVIGKVLISTAFGGKYGAFISDLDVCNDGSGPDYNDPSYQTQTAYYNNGKFLNADKDKYIVVPPQVRSMVDPVVMGCMARMTNLRTGHWSAAVCGEIGPDDKTGEAAYCLAKELNPEISHNSGDSSRVYLYEFWPGIPAVVDGKFYNLEPA
jgi:hypothetical protein